MQKRTEPVSVRLVGIKPIGKIPDLGMSVPELVDGRVVESDEYIKQKADAVNRIGQLLRERLATSNRKELFIFVHGFNNTFETAACRMAQLWHYLGHIGVPMIYSWPAGHPGLLKGYNHDRESSEFTVYHFRQLLKSVAMVPELKKIHIIGHSRGTDVVMLTLRDLRLQVAGARVADFRRFKIGHVVLAAPDLDWDVTQQKFGAERLHLLVPEFFTLYINPRDFALAISNSLFSGKDRLGNLGDSKITGKHSATMNNFPNFSAIRLKSKRSRKSHDYFVSNPAVLSDLILLLKENRRPGKAEGRPLKKLANGIWQIGDEYPQLSKPTPQSVETK
jgi:esterase/lipase superfamily enzyme